MSPKLNSAIAGIGIDVGKNSFHVVGHDRRGAIVLRQKWSRGQVETRLTNLPPCLSGDVGSMSRFGRKPTGWANYVSKDGAPTGKRTVNTEPLPISLATVTSP